MNRHTSVRALALACVLALVSGPAAAETLPARLGHPPDARLLLMHGDDLGMAHAVNRASFEALERGWITSASIIVPGPWFPEVARWAVAHPDADLGIHLTLNSEWTDYRWRPISNGVPSLVDADGYFPLTQQPVVERGQLGEVEQELRAQIERALAAGIHLTHLDAHMGTVAMTEPMAALYRRLGDEYGLPIRMSRAEGVDEGRLIDRSVGIATGVPAAGWQAAYQKMLAELPPGGVYELILHLGYADAELRGATWDHPDWGAAWRQQDFDTVRNPNFRRFLEAQGFILVGWADLAKEMTQ